MHRKTWVLSARWIVTVLLAGGLLAACAPEAPAVVTEPAATEEVQQQPEEVSTVQDEPAAEPGDPAAIPECLRDRIGCAVIPPDETIKIGMGGPMTGDFQLFGIDIRDAGVLAVEDVGRYLGWSFELVQGDTQGSPAEATVIASEWVRDPTMVAIAGHIFSGETAEVMPIYEQAGLPMMSPSATNPELTSVGSPVFNRVTFTDIVQAESAARYLYRQLGVRQLAVLHDGEPYGEGLAEIVADNFAELGGTVVALETVDPAQRDLTATLQAIIETNTPEAVYYGGYDDVGIAVVNELARLRTEGVEPAEGDEVDPETVDERYDILFFGCDGTFGTNFRTGTGENGEGAYATSLTPPDTEARAAFDVEFIGTYNRPPGQDTPYTWHGYDAVGSLIFAVKSVAIVGEDGYLYVPRGQLIDAVRHLTDYPGVTGDITCDEVGECSTSGPRFYTIQDGEWVPAS